jgi:biofilm PGA synthesis N-glycosyltransferase PgaC
MKIIFWLSIGTVAYTYFGYVVYLWIRKQFWSRPVRKGACERTVSVILVVHNEEARLPIKLRNLQSIEYPPSKLEIIVASDASTDGTDAIIAAAEHSSTVRVKRIECPVRCGKSGALAKAIAAARGEILFFTDVRQMIEPGALGELVANFADPAVGCVSGELMLRSQGGIGAGFSAYWKFEKTVRKLEASVGSTVGATGAIYAARRLCVVPPPAGTLVDDVYIPIHVARHGLRVVFEPAARAWDDVTGETNELRRRVRTLAGNYQMLELAPWLLAEANPMRAGFINHKLCRLLVPFLLLLAAAANLALVGDPVYVVVLALHASFYLAALAGMLLPRQSVPWICGAASAFVLLNTAAFLAPFEYMLCRKDPIRLWESTNTVRMRRNPATGGPIDDAAKESLTTV